MIGKILLLFVFVTAFTVIEASAQETTYHLTVKASPNIIFISGSGDYAQGPSRRRTEHGQSYLERPREVGGARAARGRDHNRRELETPNREEVAARSEGQAQAEEGRERMTDLEYWRGFLTWVDVHNQVHPSGPGPCGFAVQFAARYEAALRDADRDPGGES